MAGEYFVGREEEFRQFEANLDGLGDGTANHAFVAGLHGAGKTSYLDRLTDLAQHRGFLGVLTNVNEQAKGVESVKAILSAIAAAIQEWGEQNNLSLNTATDWDRGADSTLFRQAKIEKLEADRVRKDFTSLSKIAADAGARGIVLCIDEGQWIPPDALSALKSALEAQKHVVAIVSLRLPTVNIDLKRDGRAQLDAIAREAGGDIGASRLYTTEIAMGPFADEGEALRCIERRLKDNAIRFEKELSIEIIQLAERIPREIIRYSHKVYARALESQREASLALLDEVVRDEHAGEVAQAASLVESQSGSVQAMLKALLDLNGCATSRQLAQRFQTTADEKGLAMIADGVSSQLESVCDQFSGLRKLDEYFEITSRVHFYALRIALKER